MRALRWDGTRLALARDAPDPRPGAGEALVRVHLAGICRTDLEITRGYLGFRGTPGHEWVGHVLAADDPALVGRRVVGEINLGCGVCRSCRAGLGRHCPTRRVLGILGADGAFAELIAVPAANLHPVPETIADREAVFTEPLAAAFEILDQMPSLAGAHAVVLGDGKLGLLVAQVLAGAGAEVVLAGRHETKLARARALGIRTGPPPPGADLVVDASGAPDGLALALALVRPRGTVVLKTTVAAASRVPAASEIWLALAVANMATITVCAWLAAGDVRGRGALAYPFVVSKLVSSGTELLLFVQCTHAFPLLTIALVDLPIAVILLRALGRARPAA